MYNCFRPDETKILVWAWGIISFSWHHQNHGICNEWFQHRSKTTNFSFSPKKQFANGQLGLCTHLMPVAAGEWPLPSLNWEENAMKFLLTIWNQHLGWAITPQQYLWLQHVGIYTLDTPQCCFLQSVWGTSHRLCGYRAGVCRCDLQCLCTPPNRHCILGLEGTSPWRITLENKYWLSSDKGTQKDQ